MKPAAHDNQFCRRDVLKALTAAATSAALGSAGQSSHAQVVSVRWSSGTAPPTLKAPPHAADCHFHIYDARYPAAPNAVLHPPDALVGDYRGLQRRIGTSRCV